LAHKAEEVGFHPNIILSGRRINDGMGNYVASQIVKLMIKKSIQIEGSKVLVLGITFKENCPDIRNSRVIDVIQELKEFGCKVDVYDPWADFDEVEHEYKLKLQKNINLDSFDAIVLAVSHNEFKQLDIKTNDKQVIYDVKAFLDEYSGRL
jgi:UDP-N-acetyl-D-galactosamine dehydrogenase